MTAVLDAAVGYAALGWRIFPCDPHPEKPRSKRPLIVADKDDAGKSIEGSGWPAKATTNEAQIRAWWRRWPHALIGMAPGWAGGYVVDLDPKGESVDEVEARLAAALGAPLPAGPRTITQSGGRHIWFRRPEGGPWGNEPPGLKHIDIRCDAGYVILPPSVLANGNAYAWEGEPFDPATAPEVPPALLELIARRKTHWHAAGGAPQPRERGSARVVGSGAPGDEAKRRYARGVLDRIAADLARAPEGARGTELFKAACALGRFVAAGAISEREALAALEDGADANGLAGADGRARVGREIRRGLDEGRRDAADTIARLEEIAREAAVRGVRSAGGVRAPEPPLPVGAAFLTEDNEEEDGWEDIALDDESGPSECGRFDADVKSVSACAKLDHSDVDNAVRFIAHFGKDLVVLETEGITNTEYFVWSGTHWDTAGGNDGAMRLAKKVGGLIGLEAEFLAPTPDELRAMEDGDRAEEDFARLEKSMSDWGDAEKARERALRRAIEAGTAARRALDKRKVARRKFGISSKNKARIVAMKDLAACDLTRKPNGFDANPLTFACMTHTVHFRREVDPECPDPDEIRYKWHAVPVQCHRRGDFITKILPVSYESDASAPLWEAFLRRFLPQDSVRKCFQVGIGLGLLGLPVQKVFFHYGNGANGKSVALETVTRVLGQHAVSLPTEAITGTGERHGGQASPELARLHGVRFARIHELPAKAPLKEEVVKKLTGGEAIPVRNLFKGFFEFQPQFVPHMSGNGYPMIDGTDNGIWRRMAVIHWPVTLTEEQQRDFEEVVGELVAEASGILNWMIEGALIYLREGLKIPEEVRMATQEYRDEMDVVGQFARACVLPSPGQRVQARQMYSAYVAWAEANGKKPVSETRFGKDISKLYSKSKGHLLFYNDCTLQNVPSRPEPPRSPSDG